MNHFTKITSPLDQFEIRDLVSLNAPIFGNLHISLTNIGLYLILGVLITLTLHILAINYNKVVSNH
jgi:F-type H+-transporting ATPase subunit a